MRFRTFAGLALTVFALPAAHALAADPPRAVAQPVPIVLPLPALADGAPPVTAPLPCVPPMSAAQLVAVPPAPCALPVPTPVVVVRAADSWAAATPLDYLRKLAAAHAETGARASYVVKMRNVAAVDAASAIQKHSFMEKVPNFTVMAEPVSNTLVASGEPEHVRRALDLAAALDVAPPQVVVSGQVMTVSREFLETAGLSTEKGAMAWTLSARETHMLAGLIRAEKANGKMEVLSRPQIQVCDKQTGHVQVGQDVVLAGATETKIEGTTTVAVEKPVSRFVGLNLKVTPKFAAGGESIALAVESDFSKVAPGLGIDLGNGQKVLGINAASVRATAILKKGESFVLATHGDKGTVTLVVLTPAPVLPACPGWFTK